MTDFKREERYIVIKLKDLDEGQVDDLRGNLVGIRTRECVVVEAGWPIYEETWENVQRLAEGRPSIGEERDALEAHVEAASPHITAYCNFETDAHEFAVAMAEWKKTKPTTSLARLKAQWQREALERLRTRYCNENGGLFTIVDDEIEQLRRQAEGDAQ